MARCSLTDSYLLINNIKSPLTLSAPFEKDIISSDSDRRGTFRVSIRSVVRKKGESDIFYPSICPTSCEQDFGALTILQNETGRNLIQEQCSCKCPLISPVFLPTKAACVNNLRVHAINSNSEQEAWQIETNFVLTVVIIVIILVVVTCVTWNICWSIKKRKLINDFQLQYIQQYRHNESNASGSSLNQFTLEESSIGEPTYPPLMSKRRLVFNSDYFDYEQLLSPSPLALQFLCDLKNAVSIAKERIRQRRFHPSLEIIAEENVYDCDRLIDSQQNSIQQDREFQARQESPHSLPRSVDSGRESREVSDDEDKNDNESKTGFTVSELVQKIGGSVPRPSLVPILLNSSMRHKSYSFES
ncbi:unnamed protein product [Caenorhabditis sp. 36 PRJEB53466]|nr:unnamed protein product [Caenorhabditis sp. 36 PRJEB53466]